MERYRIDVLYVFKYPIQYIDGAKKRLICSINSIIKQNIRPIIINASTENFVEELSMFPDIIYKYIKFDQQFNKAKLINYGVKHCVETNYFILSDIDLIYPNNYIEKMFEYINQVNKKYRVIPFNHNLHEEFYSTNISELCRLPKDDIGGFAHGNGLIHRDSLCSIRGYNESFVGYGPEDAEFNERIEKINTVLYDKNIVTMHLWHESFNRIQCEKNSDIYHQVQYNLQKYSRRKIDNFKISLLCSNIDKWGEL